MKHTLTIPDWHPVSVNKLMRLHWSERNRLLKLDADMVAGYAKLAGTPTARGKRQVRLTFSGPGELPDPDNLLKSALDALVRAGLVVDDSSQWCGVTVSCVKGRKSTVIELEDCP